MSNISKRSWELSGSGKVVDALAKILSRRVLIDTYGIKDTPEQDRKCVLIDFSYAQRGIPLGLNTWRESRW